MFYLRFDVILKKKLQRVLLGLSVVSNGTVALSSDSVVIAVVSEICVESTDVDVVVCSVSVVFSSDSVVRAVVTEICVVESTGVDVVCSSVVVDI